MSEIRTVMSSVESRELGVVSATLGTLRLVGQALSLSLVAILLALFVGGAPATPAMGPQLLVSVRWEFLAFCALCLVGVFVSLARGRVRD